MAEQRITTIRNAFWIAGIFSVLLLAIYVLVSANVTFYNSTDLGLLTKLPIAFWTGLSLLVTLLYVSRKSERQTIIIVVLISFYLFGIPLLMRENKAEWLQISYQRVSEGVALLSEDHLALNNLNYWDFRSWPGFFYFTAFLSSLSGLPATVFSDYFPLLTTALLGVITYSILKLRLNTLNSSFGVLWFIASFWTSQHYFGPQSFAYVISCAIILLLAKLFFIKRQNIKFSLTIIFLFTATVVSHLLTSFIIMASIFTIYFSQKIIGLRFRTNKIPSFYSISNCIFLATIFFSYHILVIKKGFSQIMIFVTGEISQGETHISQILVTRIIGSTGYLMELVGTYSLTIINVVIAILVIFTTALGLLLKKKEKIPDTFWIALIIVSGLFGSIVRYGGEAIERAFMFALLPVSYFSIKLLSKKPRFLILVLIILILIHIPADYANENYTMVPTSEFKGLSMLAEYKPPTSSFFYDLPTSYYEEIRGRQISISAYGRPLNVNNELVNNIVRQAEITVYSDLQRNYKLYFLGVDPLEGINLDNHNNRIYDNGGFRLYS